MILRFVKAKVCIDCVQVFDAMRSTRSNASAANSLASQYSFNPQRKNKLKHSEEKFEAQDEPANKSNEDVGQSRADPENENHPSIKQLENKAVGIDDKTTKPKQQKKRGKVKIEYEMESEEGIDQKKAKSEKWTPNNWDQILKNIREMRKSMDAPVDTMGCDVSHELNLSPEVRRYQVLISLMLSSQTKDEVNFAAMTRLREHGLTIDKILITDEEIIGKLIYPVGFWKTKAKNIKKVTQILREEYGDDIPNSIETLCKLPGVGPKMAHLAMNVGWGIVTGIGVDTHVHRIANRLGWVRRETKTPEGTRLELEAWLPQELWSEVNHLLVGFGQTKCRSTNPDCSTCLNLDICPYPTANKKSGKNKKRK